VQAVCRAPGFRIFRPLSARKPRLTVYSTEQCSILPYPRQLATTVAAIVRLVCHTNAFSLREACPGHRGTENLHWNISVWTGPFTRPNAELNLAASGAELFRRWPAGRRFTADPNRTRSFLSIDRTGKRSRFERDASGRPHYTRVRQLPGKSHQPAKRELESFQIHAADD